MLYIWNIILLNLKNNICSEFSEIDERHQIAQIHEEIEKYLSRIFKQDKNKETKRKIKKLLTYHSKTVKNQK